MSLTRKRRTRATLVMLRNWAWLQAWKRRPL